MLLRNSIALLLVVFLGLAGQSKSAKILSISFMSSPSHKITYEPLLYRLAELGHDVTIVSPVKSSKKVTKNVRLFETIPLEEFQKDSAMPNFFAMKQSESKTIIGELFKFFFNAFFMFTPFMENICRKQYELPIIQQLLDEHEKEKFDLVLLTPMFNECLYGMVHKMNVTNILINQVPLIPWVGGNLGNPNLPSFVPAQTLTFSDKMTLFERMLNFLTYAYQDLTKNWLYDPQVERTYREFFRDPSMPGIREIEANASIVLCNAHVAISAHRPQLPDIINVGGMQLKSAKPLPENLEEFVSGSKDGFILFSMGSALKGTDLPETHRKIILNTFAKLKQRVLWKWETEKMDDLPANVKLSKWLPQHDVLGHKNIKLFITHGGHGSTTEAVYYGVPLVGIPIFGDQKFNMLTGQRHGFAVPLDLNELTEELLYDTIQKVLNEPSYRESVKKLSSIYRDDINHPLDRAVFHVEYVLRHQGARHLRSAARDLNLIQYYSVDVIAILLGIAAIVAYIDFVLVRMVLRKCCGKKQGKSDRTKKVQ